MKKIKKFKIDLSIKKIFDAIKSKNLITTQDFIEEEVAKFYKINDLQFVKPEKRELIQKAIDISANAIVPAMLYVTLNKKRMQEFFSGADNPVKLSEKWLAVSFWVVTIGNGLETEIDRLKQTDDAFVAQLLDAIGWEALRIASGFASRLISIEAKKQECELTSYIDNYCDDWDHSINQKVFEIIEIEKLGVTFNDDNKLFPPKSMISMAGWNALYKSKKESR